MNDELSQIIEERSAELQENLTQNTNRINAEIEKINADISKVEAELQVELRKGSSKNEKMIQEGNLYISNWKSKIQQLNEEKAKISDSFNKRTLEMQKDKEQLSQISLKQKSIQNMIKTNSFLVMSLVATEKEISAALVEESKNRIDGKVTLTEQKLGSELLKIRQEVEKRRLSLVSYKGQLTRLINQEKSILSKYGLNQRKVSLQKPQASSKQYSMDEAEKADMEKNGSEIFQTEQNQTGTTIVDVNEVEDNQEKSAVSGELPNQGQVMTSNEIRGINEEEPVVGSEKISNDQEHKKEGNDKNLDDCYKISANKIISATKKYQINSFDPYDYGPILDIMEGKAQGLQDIVLRLEDKKADANMIWMLITRSNNEENFNLEEQLLEYEKLIDGKDSNIEVYYDLKEKPINITARENKPKITDFVYENARKYAYFSTSLFTKISWSFKDLLNKFKGLFNKNETLPPAVDNNNASSIINRKNSDREFGEDFYQHIDPIGRDGKSGTTHEEEKNNDEGR